MTAGRVVRLSTEASMMKLILIAEDEYGLGEVVAQMLGDHGHEVELVLNGHAALVSMEARRPDLLLVDLMMPVLDGADVVRRMRADPPLAAVPVVLMTARPGAIPSDITANVQAVLAKPFTPEALLRAVDGILT
jgi:two-component system, OmpR family, response regulator MtrA